MRVKDVIALAAANLGRDDLQSAVYDIAGEPEGDWAALLRCYNLVENEIALDYYPLKTEETFETEDGTVNFARFSYAPVCITSVADERGEAAFELFPARLRVKEGAGKRVTVRYTYSPAQKKWNDDSEYSGKISARLMSFGVASEFCLTGGLYQEAAMWDKKYRDALKAANIVRKKLAVRSRRWV